MIVQIDDLTELANQLLVGNGLSEEDAHIVTDILVEAELRGRATHGMIRLPGILDRVKTSQRVAMRLERDGGGYALVDGQGNLGYLVAHRATRTAISKADSAGLAVVGAHNTSHCGMLGYYASMLADAGYAALVMCDTAPFIAPWGSSEAVLGTNPIAAAFPCHAGQVLIDLSTAAVTNGQILMALKSEEEIPYGTAVDSEGNLTRDPVAAREGAVLPFGGHKGYALSMMVQILSGAMVKGDPVPDRGKNYGLFMLAVDPGIFGDRKEFQTSVAQLIGRVKGARRAKGVEEILIPGERAYREREMRKETGVDIDDVLLGSMKQM